MEAPSLLLLLFLVGSSTCEALRLHLTHIDATTQNSSPLELIRRAVERTKIRTTVRGFGTGEYTMDMAIGTPPMAFSAVLDTGSDLMWVRCDPKNQSGPIYDPSSSSTFSKVPCSSQLCNWLTTRTCESGHCHYYYSYSYSHDKLTHGILATDTVTFVTSTKQARFPHIGFGCEYGGTYEGPQQASGYVGLGRGHHSLTSQLGITKFSYCLTTFGSPNRSHLFLGPEADLNQDSPSNVRSIQLSQNPNKPSLYFLSLKSVTIGTTQLRIQNKPSDYGNGALIIDSGASITALDYKLYEPVLTAFKSQIKLPFASGKTVGLDLCFSVPSNGKTLKSLKLPKLVFHFEGGSMEFPIRNYMSMHSDDGLVCLAMCRSFGMESVLGNFQQQNIHMLFELEKERLSFVKARCDQL